MEAIEFQGASRQAIGEWARKQRLQHVSADEMKDMLVAHVSNLPSNREAVLADYIDHYSCQINEHKFRTKKDFCSLLVPLLGDSSVITALKPSDHSFMEIWSSIVAKNKDAEDAEEEMDEMSSGMESGESDGNLPVVSPVADSVAPVEYELEGNDTTLDAIIDQSLLGCSTVFKVLYAPNAVMEVPNVAYRKYVAELGTPQQNALVRGSNNHADFLCKLFAGKDGQVFHGTKVSGETWVLPGGTQRQDGVKVNVDTELEPRPLLQGAFSAVHLKMTSFRAVPDFGDRATVSVEGVVQSYIANDNLVQFNIISADRYILRAQSWSFKQLLIPGDAVKLVHADVDLEWKRVNLSSLATVSILSHGNQVPALNLRDVAWPSFKRPEKRTAASPSASPKKKGRAA